MTDSGLDKTGSRDLLTLAQTASLPELIDALEDGETLNEGSGPVPPKANQIARLIISRVIRLIRLGTQSELADAWLEVLRVLSRPDAELLAERFPEAHRLLSGAAVALRAATSPASSGGELTVLRGWKGNALRALKMVEAAEASEISRAILRERLGVDESYLSHMLAALEAAGLLVRVRDGRTVTVRTGPAASSDHVRAFLASSVDDGRNRLVEEVKQLFQTVLSRGSFEEDAIGIPGVAALQQQLMLVERKLKVSGTEIASTIADDDCVACRICLHGTMQMGLHDGMQADRRLVWVARLEGGAVAELETWSSLEEAPTPATSAGEILPPAQQAYASAADEVPVASLGSLHRTLQVSVLENVEFYRSSDLNTVIELTAARLSSGLSQESSSTDWAGDNPVQSERVKPRSLRQFSR